MHGRLLTPLLALHLIALCVVTRLSLLTLNATSCKLTGAPYAMNYQEATSHTRPQSHPCVLAEFSVEFSSNSEDVSSMFFVFTDRALLGLKAHEKSSIMLTILRDGIAHFSFAPSSPAVAQIAYITRAPRVHKDFGKDCLLRVSDVPQLSFKSIQASVTF